MKEIFYDWGGANVWLFHAINNVRSQFLDQFMLLGTALGDHANFPVFLCVVSFAALLSVAINSRSDPHRQENLALRWLAVIVVFSAAYVLDGWLVGWFKTWLNFPRPFLALPPGSVHVVGSPQLHHSLPSGHSSFAMLVIASLWPMLKRGGRVMGIVFVLWVGLSRISLGAHFPADVVAAYLISALMVSLVWASINALLRRINPGNKFAD